MATIERQYYTQGAGLQSIIKSYNPDIALFSTYIEWTIESQDVLNNSSVITWAYKIDTYDLSAWQTSKSGFGTAKTLLIGHTGSSSYNDVYVSIDDTVRYSTTTASISVESNKTVTLASGEITLAHSTDGTLSPAFSTYIYVKDFYNASGVASINNGQLNAKCSASGNLLLEPIPRHAVILSAPEKFTDEESPTIEFAIPSSATEVKAYISFSTSTIDIGPVNISGSSHPFTFSEADKKKLWSILDQGLTTKPMYFYVTSKYQGELYHSGPILSTLEVINYKPIINTEINDIYDTNEKSKLLTGDPHKLIRYVSNAYYNIGAEARKGATIESVSIKNGNLTKYSSTGTFEGVTSPDFVYTATDSRGTSIPSTTTRFEESTGYWIPYVKLTCSSEVTEMTADGYVAVTLKGMFFNGNFSASKQNRLRMSYDLYKNNEVVELNKDWGYIDRDSGTNASTGNPAYFTYDAATSTYTYEFTIPGLDYMSVYELFIRVSDEIAVEGVEAHTIIASEPIFDWGRTDFNFNVPVNIEGDLTVAGNITAGGNTVPTIMAQGTAGIWTYRTWSDGTAECWGKKDVSVTFPSTANWGGLFTTGAISASNVSFPYGLFADIPVVNASLLIRSVGGILMAPGGNDSNKATWDQTGIYEIARGAPVSGTQYYTINYQVIGRWK